MTGGDLGAVRALYDEVPDVECRGLCHGACGPIRMSVAEHDRIREAHGVEIPTSGVQRCPALGLFKQCTVYEDRPMLCRLWGATTEMPCRYGCRPRVYLRPDAGRRLLDESIRLGGGVAGGTG